MKRFYPVLAALLLTSMAHTTSAQTTAWRPFRPGLIYTYADPQATALQLHSLRVDSSYATSGGDSVYTFNRLLRKPSSGSYGYYRSRNNLFGARLRWRPGTAEYYLEANAETVAGTAFTPTAISLRLLPRAAVGSTWQASSQPALTATLSNRGLGTGTAATDTVATITLSNGQVVKMGRQSGLIQGPQWLDIANASAGQWQAYYEPQTLLQSPYSPIQLFRVLVGDRLGYETTPIMTNPFPCYEGHMLREITSQQIVGDSLIMTYRQQRQYQTFAYPNCSGASNTVYPVENGRWAFSMRTGKSPQFTTLGLLTGEYQPYPNAAFNGLEMSMGIGTTGTTGICTSAVELRFQRVYNGTSGPPGFYYPGIDYLGWQQVFAGPDLNAMLAYGAGDLQTHETRLVYIRRVIPGVGTYSSCGNASSFSTLLSSRAAQATAAATLAPNPANDQATLTLTQPLTKAATLTLTDALGRRVWQGAVAAGQNSAAVPLASQPAGLYLVQMQTGNSALLTWKLTHE
ncbi:T9SS type A sorting domain-containing protein [Hymenobacter sp. ASUV-10]|uniref:T9SS type A sorting domain-containing protein n=1 Tax=Hymenobacter aranciens TaxID=3063996 RepID=A0ABT9B797_9BACT|nr:T9SS type A sorting domain-containing protein [Hymenobacter sp. ASUV-10]MDO7874068.1 T9SS type A sorting domain-containing protein [Hymenobacter sp. ASUV-10]